MEEVVGSDELVQMASITPSRSPSLGCLIGRRWSPDGIVHSSIFRTVGVLYCFFSIAHDLRRIVYCNVTKHLARSGVNSSP